MTYGNYDEPIDQHAEKQAILDNPPAAFGNPGASSILSTLKAKFEKAEARPTTKYIKARNEVLPNLVIEVDTKMSEAEYRDYQEGARLPLGNRTARRAGEKGPVSAERFGARMLVEKTIALYNGDPEDVSPESDASGSPLTFRSDELITALGHAPGDAVNAVITLFGFPTLVSLGEAYLAATGFGEDAEIVDPTSGSSGV